MKQDIFILLFQADFSVNRFGAVSDNVKAFVLRAGEVRGVGHARFYGAPDITHAWSPVFR